MMGEFAELNVFEYLRLQLKKAAEGKRQRSDYAVIQRLLERYSELESHINIMYQTLTIPQMNRLIDLVIDAVAFGNEDEVEEVRNTPKELKAINDKIASLAFELAEQLDKRTQFHNKTSFTSNTHYALFKLIEDAGSSNYLFESFLKESLRNTVGPYDLKYYPSIRQVVIQLGVDAKNALIETSSELDLIITRTERPSNADQIRAILEILQFSQKNDGHYSYFRIPDEFEMSNQAIAAFVNVAFDIPFDKLVDDIQVRNAKRKYKQLCTED
ncbi:hypothetical protein MJ923_14815 [Shewanella sp. 3B26]|uniref:Uncharacterized protein n=1 Tax=Shewanella zhuhaiensis TaxID=2919576 RepID=A0AAJ1F1J1_9GAMM|nr:hypothetical protein [Shewanella zhuhaiensis]MCH4295578.1 hypothetical protein [Shewanella zhuhaiensis]